MKNLLAACLFRTFAASGQPNISFLKDNDYEKNDNDSSTRGTASDAVPNDNFGLDGCQR